MVKEKRLLFGTTLKYFDIFDVALLKLTIISFTLFVVSAWPVFASWATTTSWTWFLAAWILFAIRPLMKAFRR
ncbi:hypothetical protein COV20_03470 [Candidatus Woesearchaeota archaeon CG10_big_fil_rev_8_21_14_0_10_45_16]|nr:MAG: hypothetical protein COV20_03470 [Candidatus Woesearchaeota archaeon CG10_big_fil_rev_8_21_14_0_10_45_16]